MAIVRKLDSKRRLVFPGTFRPGDIFLEEDISTSGIRFSLVKPEEVPIIDVDL
jgi:DNA-binding transcriptional regulator/RsmH inhibitor MraZ